MIRARAMFDSRGLGPPLWLSDVLSRYRTRHCFKAPTRFDDASLRFLTFPGPGLTCHAALLGQKQYPYDPS